MSGFLSSIGLHGQEVVTLGIVFVTCFLALLAMDLVWSVFSQRRRRRGIVERLRGITSAEVRHRRRAASVLLDTESRDQLSSLLQRISVGQSLGRIVASSGSDISVGGFALRMAVLGLLAGSFSGVAMHSVVAGVIGVTVGAYLPIVFARMRAKKRIRRFEEGFPEAIDLLARALLAGHPFSSALRMVADETRDPIRSEFRQLFEEQKYGMPADESLRRFGERMAMLDVHIFVTAVLVQREIGGDLAEILGNISRTIRERFVIRRQVDTFTAQGRMTGYMLGALPFVLGFVIYLLNPDNMLVFFTDPRGKLMLGVALGMQVTGLLIIRKIIDIDI